RRVRHHLVKSQQLSSSQLTPFQCARENSRLWPTPTRCNHHVAPPWLRAEIRLRPRRSSEDGTHTHPRESAAPRCEDISRTVCANTTALLITSPYRSGQRSGRLRDRSERGPVVWPVPGQMV